MTEPCDLSATDLLVAYAARTLSPVETIDSLLDRLNVAEPLLCATWAVDADAARAEAKASEARWGRGEPLGTLDGVPVSIKEMVATRGVAMPVGTAAGDLTPQLQDAPPAARLREAGAILWGKTTNPDFGMLSSGLSSFHRLARNPWDLSKTPGGSSAGASAGAAAGYGPLHLGTDIGGSVRLPAGWCGIVALKPSNGRVPIDPPYFGRVAGPMTRTAADSALMMQVLTRHDERDYMSLPPVDIDWADLTGDAQGRRIGVMREAGCGLPVDPAIAEALDEAVRRFAEAGAAIVEVPPMLTRAMLDGMDRFWRLRFFAQTQELPPERYAAILPYIRAWVEAARDYDAMQAYTGFDQIIRIREAARDAFSGLDFLLTPTAPIAAFPAELAGPTNDPARPFEHIGFTLPWNMSDHPAASVNMGYTQGGLPIGLQIVGRRFDDLGVLQMTSLWEQIRPAQRPWPRPWEERT